MRKLLLAAIAGGLLAAGCQLPEKESPNEPDPLPEGPATVTAAPGPTGDTPGIGAPAASPTPAPEGEGEGEGEGDEGETEPPEETSSPPPIGCGEPVPPAISRIKVTIHLRGADHWTLDATPLVGPDPDYCAAIGFTDGRENCPVRPDGHPEREACEAWGVGNAMDTGRPGPTWRRNGSFCSGPASGCENHAVNQYLLKAILAGTYEACARNGACGSTEVDR